MECALTSQAGESDTDILAAVTRRWEAAVDPDGAEPTEELLRTRQGVFDRGIRRGLHRLEIVATDAQYEALITVMNTVTNPRTRPATGTTDPGTAAADSSGDTAGDGTAHMSDAQPLPDPRTRARKLLDGLAPPAGWPWPPTPCRPPAARPAGPGTRSSPAPSPPPPSAASPATRTSTRSSSAAAAKSSTPAAPSASSVPPSAAP